MPLLVYGQKIGERGDHGSREAHISGLQTECTVALLQAGI